MATHTRCITTYPPQYVTVSDSTGEVVRRVTSPAPVRTPADHWFRGWRWTFHLVRGWRK